MTEQTHGRLGAALFAKDVGIWDAEVIVTPGPGAPAQESRGVLTARLICGAKWLVADFRNTTTGFEGHGVYGFNPATSRYEATWIDDMRGSIVVGVGDWDESRKTITYEFRTSRPDGTSVVWRETTELIQDGEQLFRTLFLTPDGSEFEVMRARYRRRPNSPAA